MYGHVLYHSDVVKQGVILPIVANWRAAIACLSASFPVKWRKCRGWEVDRLRVTLIPDAVTICLVTIASILRPWCQPSHNCRKCTCRGSNHSDPSPWICQTPTVDHPSCAVANTTYTVGRYSALQNESFLHVGWYILINSMYQIDQNTLDQFKLVSVSNFSYPLVT